MTALQAAVQSPKGKTDLDLPNAQQLSVGKSSSLVASTAGQGA